MSLIVVGSLNLDRFACVASLPRPGETVIATRSFTRFGGKGANQAIAAARLGGRVTLVGALGADDIGAHYRERLRHEGVDDHYLVTKEGGVGSGTATIAVDARGENTIIVDPGANDCLTADDVAAAQPAIAVARVLLVQWEVPPAAVLAAVRRANAAGVAVVLNPSPWRDDFPWSEVRLHSVIVNETELAAWRREKRHPDDLPIERLIVTQGARPTLGFSANAALEVPPPRIEPVDTVGAGDAFAGAYAVALAEGRDFAAALRFANRAGALATLQPGAQEALPTRAAVEQFDRR